MYKQVCLISEDYHNIRGNYIFVILGAKTIPISFDSLSKKYERIAHYSVIKNSILKAFYSHALGTLFRLD